MTQTQNRLEPLDFELRICFGFRASNCGFNPAVAFKQRPCRTLLRNHGLSGRGQEYVQIVSGAEEAQHLFHGLRSRDSGALEGSDLIPLIGTEPQ